MKSLDSKFLRSAVASRPALWLALITAVCFLPFIGKAFHIDDPLFIWVARQICDHPLDFYGFEVNWYGRMQSVAAITKNPPGGAYLLALLGTCFGWNEWALHGGFVLVSVAAVLGTYRLARELTPHPVLAALCGLFTPVFLISGTQVMCDVPMVALWVWSLYLWVSGERLGRSGRLWGAAALAAAAALTKYFGAALVPLLLVYSVTRHRGPTRRLVPLLLPVLVLAGYQYYTARLYGHGMLSDAAQYATTARPASRLVVPTFRGLIFSGGCLVSLLAFAPWLGSRRTRLIWGAGVGLLAMALLAAGGIDDTVWRIEWFVRWELYLTAVLFALAGCVLAALVVADLRSGFTADAVLLALWLVGTFIFAAFINWSLNGRSLLPMAPALGVLLARRLRLPIQGWRAAREPASAGSRWCDWPGVVAAMLTAAAISILPAWADCQHANSARAAARKILAQPAPKDNTVWFQGHWGFQYYMEQSGAKALDWTALALRPGDQVVMPRTNTNVYPLDPAWVERVSVIRLPPNRWLACMDPQVCAGFYVDEWGPFPFAFGTPLAHEYAILTVRVPVQGSHAKTDD